MALEFVLGWFFEDIEFLRVDRSILFFTRQRGKLLPKVFVFLLQRRYFFLESKYGFPFDLEAIALGVDISEADRDLLCKDLRALLIIVLDEVFENVLVELVLLLAG